MSLYTERCDIYGLHSSHISTSDVRHRLPDDMHADAHQTVEELTEWLEARGALAAPARPKQGEERKKGRLRSFSSSLLTPPLSSSDMALNVADIIALYLRRQRYAIQRGKEGEVSASAAIMDASMAHHVSSLTLGIHDGRALESYSLKLLLLGYDAVVQELAAMLRAEAEEKKAKLRTNGDVSNRANGVLYGRQISSLSSTARAAALPSPEVYTLPDAVEDFAALRAELCRWCDVILLCYSVADSSSFVHLQEDIAPAVLAACSHEEEDSEETTGVASRPFSQMSSSDKVALPQSTVWPAAAPPCVIVGVGAEARLSRPTDLQALWITNADVLAFAAEAGVQRVVELYSQNQRHVQILLQHCQTLREVGYEGLASPAAQGRRAALKEFGLHTLLRAPPPVLELHPGSRTVHVVLPSRIPTSTTKKLPEIKDNKTAKESDGAAQCYYAVSDAADMNGVTTIPSCPVPSNGVLSFASIYDAYAQSTGRPAQCAAAVQLTVCTAVPYLFPSEFAQLRLPTPAAPPSGYVDVVHRCCRLTIPALSPRGERGCRHYRGASRVLCSLADTTISLDVPSFSPRDGRLSAPTLVCIPLDGGEPWIHATIGVEGSAYDKDGAWQPWPSTVPASSETRLLHLVVENEGNDGQDRTTTTSSAATTFVIPPVLPAPVVEYSAVDSTLRLRVPGYRADQVDVRYTLDGSVPTSSTGLPYTGTLLLDKNVRKSSKFSASLVQGEEEKKAVVRVRAVAFPKLYFASRVAEVNVNVNQNLNLLPPQLQDDEHIDSALHVKWGNLSLTPQHQHHSIHSPRSLPGGGGDSPRRSSTSFVSKHSPSVHPHSPRSYRYSLGNNSATLSDNASQASDVPTTRTAQLRQAFNIGLYTPPRQPFSRREGYASSPRSPRRNSRR